MADPHQFFTQSVGRFVSGDIDKLRTKDHDNREIPEDKQSYSFGVAFPKNDPDIERIKTEMFQYAAMCWQHQQAKLVKLQNWWNTLDGLSMKFTDGDKPNRQGKVNENTIGHYVLWFSSKFPIKTCAGDAFAEIPADQIKRGYYVRVAGNFNDNTQEGDRSGLYMNATHVQLIAEGDTIMGGVDAATAFSGASTPAQLPAGARPLGHGAGMPMTPQQTMPGNVPPQPGMPGQMPQQTMPGNVPPQPGMPGQMPQQTMPGQMPQSAPGQMPTAPAPTAQPTVQPGVPQQTVYPTNIAPHPDIMNPPVPGQ